MNARELRDKVCDASTAVGLYTLDCPTECADLARALNDILTAAYRLAAELARTEDRAAGGAR